MRCRLLLAVALLLAAAPAWADLDSQLFDRLNAPDFNAIPRPLTVLTLTFAFPESAGGDGQLALRINSAGVLPPNNAIMKPLTALQRPGLYAGVADTFDDFVYIVRLADPEFVRGERIDASSISAVLLAGRRGAVSARVPFVAGGKLYVFETARDPTAPASTVARVILEEPMPATPPSPTRFRRVVLP